MDWRERTTARLLGETVTVQVDRPAGCLHGDICYPINYGFVPGLMGGDGEAQGAYILGAEGPVDTFTGTVIGVIRRHDDNEDKLVVAADGIRRHQADIAAAVHFQEQYFTSSIDCLYRKSCGVIPFRLRGGRAEFLILFEQFSQCWSFPKGHMEAGESEEDTARRELMEECGLTARLIPGARAGQEYPVGPKSRKEVVFFLGEAEGDPVPQAGEIGGFRWVTFEELAGHLFADSVDTCRRLLAAAGMEACCGL